MIRHLDIPLALSQAGDDVFEARLFELSAHPIPELANQLLGLWSEAVAHFALSSELFLRLL